MEEIPTVDYVVSPKGISPAPSKSSRSAMSKSSIDRKESTDMAINNKLSVNESKERENPTQKSEKKFKNETEPKESSNLV